VTAQEVLAQIQGQGYRLTLRPGGLRLTGIAQPTDEVRLLVAAHRAALMAFLEADAKAWSLHEASLEAGRLTPFPDHLHHLVDPVLVRACQVDESRRPQPAARRAA